MKRRKRLARSAQKGGGSAERSAATRPFSLLVKPASADCNLRCAYCFYLEKQEIYPAVRRHRMSDGVLEAMIGSYLQTPQPVHSFGWQGGEPTLMGTGFFRKVTELQEKYGRPGSAVANGLQTNGTLIDDELAAHLARYRFLVGVSLDGPAEIHDRYRRNAEGRGSHRDVLSGIETLQRHGVEFNILVLVSGANVDRAREVYRYLRDLGFRYQQYIPCVEFGPDGQPVEYSISEKQWGRFLVELFDEWYGRDVGRVSIRHFDSVLEFMISRRYNVCSMGGSCRSYFVVEHNGDVYPCDFFVETDLRLGNVTDTSWKSMADSSVYRAFGKRKRDWNEACDRCAYLPYCSGDCPKHRSPDGRDPRALSRLCEGWRDFYRHALGDFERLALEHLNREELRRPPELRRTWVRLPDPSCGPDDPCYCGSGKLARNCHLQPTLPV